jgi:hypothetical protein
VADEGEIEFHIVADNRGPAKQWEQVGRLLGESGLAGAHSRSDAGQSGDLRADAAAGIDELRILSDDLAGFDADDADFNDTGAGGGAEAVGFNIDESEWDGVEGLEEGEFHDYI